MKGINKAMLVGNVGKEPEFKELDGGKAVARLSLATGERWKDGERVVWHNVVFWGKLAEVVDKYVKKGDRIYVEGRIDNRSYEKDDGSKGYVSEVVAREMLMLGSQPDAAGTAEREAAGENGRSSEGNGAGINEDSVPF